jgi:carbon storage regulator CsrA
MGKLTLTRKEGESIYIGKDIIITLVSAAFGKAEIAITAPRDMQILRDNAKVRQEKPHG